MFEACNDPILEVRGQVRCTFNFRERERERDLVHFDAEYMH
jgi:hypothetical protein